MTLGMSRKEEIQKLFHAAKLSPTELTILEYLIDKGSSIRNAGIRQVASECYTSTSSIVRLAKKLDFSGFREMAFELSRIQDESASRSTGPSLDKIHFSYQPEGLRLFCDSLKRGDVIILSGEGYSRISTEYMERKLVGLGFSAVMQDCLETSQLIDSFGDRLKLAILVSKSGQTHAVVDMAKKANEAGVLTAAFTGNSKSELATCSNIVFTVRDEHPFDIENTAVNRFTGYSIVAFEEILGFAGATAK